MRGWLTTRKFEFTKHYYIYYIIVGIGKLKLILINNINSYFNTHIILKTKALFLYIFVSWIHIFFLKKIFTVYVNLDSLRIAFLKVFFTDMNK